MFITHAFAKFLNHKMEFKSKFTNSKLQSISKLNFWDLSTITHVVLRIDHMRKRTYDKRMTKHTFN